MINIYNTQIFKRTRRSTQTRTWIIWPLRRHMRSCSIMGLLFIRVVSSLRHLNALKKCHLGWFRRIRSFGTICRFASLILTKVYMLKMRRPKTKVKFTIRNLGFRFLHMLSRAIVKNTRDLFWLQKATQSRKWRASLEILSQFKLRSRRNLT